MMSLISSFAPFTSTGDGNDLHRTPSGLVANRSRSVTQPPACLIGYTAQYSLRDGIHSTSTCHANPSRSPSTVGSAGDQLTPSVDRRSSTAVLIDPHPRAPAFTLHISHSVADRRTTLGDTIEWFGACTVSTGALHVTPSAERMSQISFSCFTCR